MSVIIDYTYQNAEGQGIPGAAVELWTGDGGAGQSKVDDAADHGQGNYSLEYSASGKYTIKVNGTAVPHMTNKFLPADDILLQNHADGITLEFVDTGGGVYKLRVKAGGIGASHLGAITGPGMTKDGDGKLIPNVDGSTIIIDADNKMKSGDLSGLYLAVDSIVNNLIDGGENVPLSAEQGKALKEMLGDMDFSTDPLLKSWYALAIQRPEFFHFTNVVKVLSNRLMNLWESATKGLESQLSRVIFSDNTVASGGDAATLPEYSVFEVADLIARRGVYNKKTADVTLILTGLLWHIPPGSTPTDEAVITLAVYYDGVLQLSTQYSTAVIEDAGALEAEFSLQMDVSELVIGRSYEVRVSLNLAGGAVNTYAKAKMLHLISRGGSGVE